MDAHHDVAGVEEPSRVFRVLSAIERAGNRLPHPFWLFVILSLVLGALSTVLALVRTTVVLPSTGEVVPVRPLFSVEGLTFAVESARSNYGDFPPLTTIVVVLLGVSIAQRSGLLTAILRTTVGRLPQRYLTFSIALSAMIAHVMSDSAYLVMIPLGALAFRAAGRSPLLGLMTAYAATAVGFNASPLVTPADAIRSSLSMAAAHIVDEAYVITPVSTYFFTAASCLPLAAVIAVVVDRLISRRPEFVSADLDREFATAERLFNTTDTAGMGGEGGTLRLGTTEIRALRTSSVVLIAFLATIGAMLLPGSPFLGENGGVLESLVVSHIAVFISIGFALVGFTYGRLTGTIPSLGDVPPAMADGVRSMVPVLVLFFAVAQFLSYFKWTNIGSVISVGGAELLGHLALPHLLLLVIIIVSICLLNIVISSGAAMWSILAPVLIPLAMYIGLAPEATMVAFMIGDSVTNCVTPLNEWFVLAAGFVQQFRRGAGVGTLLSFTVPIAVSVLVTWTAFFVVWYLLGIPLGPGVPVR